MSRIPYTLKVLVPSLLVTEAIAAVQVLFSNHALYATITALQTEGYLIVPNVHIMPRLLNAGPALGGALFFTLTLGAGLAMLSLAAAWVWDRVFLRRKPALFIFILLWGALAALPNIRGFSPMPSLYFILIPPLAFIGTLRTMPRREGPRRIAGEIALAAPFALIAVFLGISLSESTFLNLRDSLLLSNRIGTAINDFYYRYTLYPAEVFKTLQQKTLKTCRMVDVDDPALAKSVTSALARYDYLVSGTAETVDLTVRLDKGELSFESGGVARTMRPTRDFLANPVSALREVSARSDRNIFFRRATFLSLVAGLPAALYVIFFGCLRTTASLVMKDRVASLTASLACLIAVAAMAGSFSAGTITIPPDRVASAIQSSDWRERTAALRTIERNDMEIANYPSYRSLLASPHIAERYWLAFVLGESRRPETYPDMMRLLDDLHPNVVCKAFEALGKRGGPGEIDNLKQLILLSDHWYVQWYAYRALRNLGWKQTASL